MLKHLQAVRALRRAQYADRVWLDHAMQFGDADQAFDSGEWSGSSAYDHIEARETRRLRAVASRYGISPGELEYATRCEIEESSARMMTAAAAKSRSRWRGNDTIVIYRERGEQYYDGYKPPFWVAVVTRPNQNRTVYVGLAGRDAAVSEVESHA